MQAPQNILIQLTEAVGSHPVPGMTGKNRDMGGHPSHPEKISHLLSGDSSIPMKWRAFSPYSTGA